MDSGLDKARDEAKSRTGGKYDQHIDTAEDKLERYLGITPDND